MSLRALAIRGRRFAVAVVVALVGIAAVAAEEEPGCPASLEAWRISGDAEPGGEWVAETLEIRGDIGLLREVVLRFGDGMLPVEEARWFDAPSALEPDELRTRTLSFTGGELLSFCRHLAGSQIDALRESLRSRCFVSDGGVRVRLKGELTVTDTETEEPARPFDGRIGVSIGGEAADEESLECERVEDLAAAFDLDETSGSDPGVFDSVYAMLEEMVGTDGPVETGLAAVPPALHVLGVLRERAGEQVPDDLPSEFHLTVTAASGPYAEALALERMWTADDPDGEVALELLGDFATPAATPLLRLKLRASVGAKRERIAALVLRALLAADSRVARLEAVPLLADPAYVRPALGVFALSDPTVRENLASLDTSDSAAVVDAGARVLAHLEATATEEEIRQAASKSNREPIP